MKVTHIIFFHDSLVKCENCNNSVFITPVRPDGTWYCPKCEKGQKITKDINVEFEKVK